MIGSNKLQSSGKTRNADRVVLLPSRYVQLILARKQKLQEILGPNVDINSLPVACRGTDYFTRCSADDITAAAKRLFAQLRIPPEQIALVNEDIQHTFSTATDPLSMLNLDLIEKEPTAYFLRRVYGTSLACLGLSEEEIAFQIGHDLGTVPEYRNEMLNTAKLLEIKSKLDLRPVVNSSNQDPIVQTLPPNSAAALPQSNVFKYFFPAGAKRINLHLSTLEPQDDIQIMLQTAPDCPVKVCTTHFTVSPRTYSYELNVASDYLRLYNQNNKEQ